MTITISLLYCIDKLKVLYDTGKPPMYLQRRKMPFLVKHPKYNRFNIIFEFVMENSILSN